MCEVETDAGTYAAAVGSGGQHRVARVGDIAGGVQTRHGGFPGRVRLHDVTEPGRVGHRVQPERGERFGTGREAGADDYSVGTDALPAGKFDSIDSTVVVGDDRGSTTPSSRNADGQPWKARNRRLLLTTNTLDSAMAAPASIGFSKPAAASGMAATL